MAANENRFASTSTSPAKDAVAVTKDDANDLATVCRALYIGTAGDGTLKVTMASGNDISLSGVPVGILPLAVKRVWSTGTGASNIVALY